MNVRTKAQVIAGATELMEKFKETTERGRTMSPEWLIDRRLAYMSGMNAAAAIIARSGCPADEAMEVFMELQTAAGEAILAGARAAAGGRRR